MTESILKTDVYTDFQGLSALRTRARASSEEALREVAGQFEALFIQMMLKTMRDASLGEGLLDNEHTSTYQAMFDKQIAIDMAKGSGIGLADMMVRQMRRPIAPDMNVEGAQAIGSMDSGEHPAMESLQLTQAMQRARISGADWKPGSPDEFIRDLWPHAEHTAEELGVRPEALIAQAALETGWGKHMIRTTDGRNSFNLFGIKADQRWHGEQVMTNTLEFRDGVMRKERDSFRSYASLAESFSDYADFLRSNPRYQQALEVGHDGAAFASSLSKAGYATDPEYASKVNSIMNSDRLSSALTRIKESISGSLA